MDEIKWTYNIKLINVEVMMLYLHYLNPEEPSSTEHLNTPHTIIWEPIFLPKTLCITYFTPNHSVAGCPTLVVVFVVNSFKK